MKDVLKIVLFETKGITRFLHFAAFLMCVIFVSQSYALDVHVVGSDGMPVSGYRWLVQEDTTYDIEPGVPDPNNLSVSFHTSYIPVVTKGHTDDSSTSISVAADKRYYISVLPDSDYTIGGASVDIGETEVTVVVNELPLPTAQISVFVFEDIAPLNNAPDIPAEPGLEGFKVIVTDAGGRFGIAGGQMMVDAFGNMLGTTYNPDGSIATVGNGSFTTDENGEVFIKNLPQGKFTIEVIPPAGEDWQQTSTIEGTKGIDAWVKPNEPPFFVEFGPPGYHVFIGFVKPMNDTTVLTGGSTIRGQVTNLHTARPPDYTFYSGEPFPGAWIGLNDLSGGNGRAIYAAPCNEDSTFEIPNVPAGTYQLVIFDDNLDIIFAFLGITVEDGVDLELGEVPVFNWFGRMQNYVFMDYNENGFRDPGEPGIPEQAVNLRFRDGTVYQAFPTDVDGYAPFDEVFPFFHWLVAEVDFLRFKATGATIIVDDGGPVLPDMGWDYPSRDVLNPQPQYESDGITPIINPNTGNNLSRTEVGMVLTEAFQVFLGQTNVIEWGKSTYDNVDIDNPPMGDFPGPGDIDHNGNGLFDPSNGGISGIVHYATTRAENDPRFAVGEEWEPGIPRVQVNLYADFNDDRIIDDLNNDGMVTLADVDNYPFDNFPGEEDIDRNDNGLFDFGDAMNITTTDSWDDNVPTGTQGEPFVTYGVIKDGYDGLRNFNQVRPGVFDGGYAFTSYMDGDTEIQGLPEETYIVEAVAPPGYEHVKEEDKNVDFGDEYEPYSPMAMAGDIESTLTLVPICVGDLHLVPDELTLFPGVPCEFAGQMRPLPDRKQVKLSRGQNAACNFFMFTEVPVAGQMVGFILDDLANEFDPNSPTFGEKYAPPWLPISIRDWKGHELSRTYSDEWGSYNALVPATYTVNVPSPSGVSPNMITVILNHPGPILDTRPGSPTYGTYITDPFFNRQYSQFPYTFQYMPGTTTYLDTPVLPIAAFAGPDQYPLDCEFPEGTPVIWSVSGPMGGPYVSNTGEQITIASAGMVEVPNPLYDGLTTTPKTIERDYGFGDTAGEVTIDGIPLTGVIWTAGVISGTVAAGTTTGQLQVTRSNGKSTLMGVTVTVGPIAGAVYYVTPSAIAGATPLQDAIDIAQPGDLILVAPGNYKESVIMWKPVQLQGWGAYSTTIDAVKAPSEEILNWRQKLEALITTGKFDLLPGQKLGFGGIEQSTFNTEEGAGITVVARNTTPAQGGFGPNPNARIDGFTITGADSAGGIFVNGYAHYLEIGNNRVMGNQGFYSGGIRIGHPFLTDETGVAIDYVHGRNDHICIHHNHITGNGGLGAAGGGISIFTGSDYYSITHNMICGNFTTGHGAGIGHSGLSEGGTIAFNKIVFNQCFNQGTIATGGGIFIGGGAPLALGTLSPGSGSVEINGNLIQGNQAGAGDGGGIRVSSANGQDVADSPDSPDNWYTIDIVNNMIINNVAGLAGGGISLQDSARVNIINNTVTHNDSTATAGEAFAPGSPNESTPQPAGIVGRTHSIELQGAFGVAPEVAPYSEFSNPTLENNIIWENRSFYFYADELLTPQFGLLPDPDTPVFWDLAVLGSALPASLYPMYCVLTDATGYDVSNVEADPLFVREYFNGDRGQTIILPEVTTPVQVAPAFDEGGNFIDVRFGPLTLINPFTGLPYGDYHITSGSPARDIGNAVILDLITALDADYDGQKRPNVGVDSGADEFYTTPTGNSAPVAIDDSYMMYENTTLTIPAPGILCNDMDYDGDNLRASLQKNVNHGTLSLSSTGSFTYVPDTDFTGTDFFRYRATDGSLNSNPPARVDIIVSVAPPNEPPAPSAMPIETLMNKTGFTQVFPGDPNTYDVHTYVVTAPPANGVPGITVTGIVSYAPNLNFIGDDSMEVTVTDQHSASGIVVIPITVTSTLTPPEGNIFLQCPPDTDNIDTDGDGIVDNDHVCMHLGAGDGFVTMADGYLQYCFGFSDLTGIPEEDAMMAGMLAATFPSPTIAVKEGQKLYLNLTNVGMMMRPDLFDPHTVHFHGFPQAAPVFDGVPDASISINMGSTLTYFYLLPYPGTYMYHCHVEATEHMQMGMLGNCYVYPKQDGTLYEYPPGSGRTYTKFAYNDGDGSTGYDVDYPIQIGSFDPEFHDASLNVQPLPFALMKDTYPMLNGRGYPDTVVPGPLTPPAENMGKISQPYSSLITANQGERILLRLSNLNVTRFYTLSSPSIPMTVVGKDAKILRSTSGENLCYNTNSVTLGGGEAMDIILDTIEVPVGTYFLHTTNLNYLSNNEEDFGGMMTEIHIQP